MRIDKFISNLGYGSRKQIIDFIKNEYVQVNSETIYEKDFEINFGDIIGVGEDIIEYKEFVYVMLNKPIGYISSKKSEGGHESYLDLLQNCPYGQIIDIVGRLDFDTSGLLLLTNNGDITHKIISPKKEIFKKYFVVGEKNLSQKDIDRLENGVKIDDTISKPAQVEIIDENKIYLSISEGRFHQIKKMFEAIGNTVTELKRVSIGNLELGDLALGEWKYLEDDDIKKLFEKK
ncbi:MAG: pseudouridine synthase [Candidatus Altimarinota bacterium]